MKDFNGEEMAGLSDVVGQRIIDIRLSHRGDGAVERFVVMFEDGSSISVDGRFPARASMDASAAELTTMPNSVFKGLACFNASPAGEKKVDSSVYQVDFAVDDRVVRTGWITFANPDFDVSAEPRISFRASSWIQKFGQ